MSKRIFGVVILMMLLINLSSVSALSVVVHVPEKYTDVHAGERFYFEIEVKYPENPQRKDLRLEYEIKTIEGDVIAQSKTLKAVETQASFIDFIVIPESAKTGLHIIDVGIKDYESLSEKVSASFHIVGKESEKIMLYLIIILIVVIFVAILAIIQVILLRRRRRKG
jgi:hypothetical protein